MTNAMEQKKLNVVVNALEKAGYNPYAQLKGYVTTGDASYITRQGGARALVRDMDERVICGYLLGVKG